MKKFIYISLIAAASIFSTSCEKDDDVTFEAKNYLEGKWVPVEIGTKNAQNIIMYTPYENDAECDVDNLTLNSDYTFAYSDFQNVDNVCEEMILDGTYRRETKYLILTTMEENEEGQPVEVETTRNIVSLTFDTMEISYTDEETNTITFLKFNKVN